MELSFGEISDRELIPKEFADRGIPCCRQSG
jgi:hypothetical protein